MSLDDLAGGGVGDKDGGVAFAAGALVEVAVAVEEAFGVVFGGVGELSSGRCRGGLGPRRWVWLRGGSRGKRGLEKGMLWFLGQAKK